MEKHTIEMRPLPIVLDVRVNDALKSLAES